MNKFVDCDQYFLYIEIDGNLYFEDKYIAHLLTIPIEEYKNLLYKHKGDTILIQNSSITELTKEEAEKLIKELEPYLILAKLTE